MFRRLAILWWKEARQQAWILGGAAVLFAFITLVQWVGSRADPSATSDMEGFGTALLLFVPIFGLILGHRMVVSEYQARTQLFLEALPLRRFETVLAKLTFGLFAQAALVLPMVYLSAHAAGDATPRFVAIVGLRAFGYLFASWGLFFGMGLLGRLRVPAYLTLACGFAVLDATTAFELSRFGPVALINPDSFPYERTVFPWRALGEAGLFGCFFLVLGGVLALFHEGSVVETLARRATAREVAGFWAIAFAGLVAFGWAEGRRERAPFEFTDASVVRSTARNAEVMYAWPALEPRGRTVLSGIDTLGVRLASELGVSNHPPLRIAHNALLEGTQARAAHSQTGAGVLLEANLGFRGFDLEQVLTDTSHALFLELSKGRAAFEPNHWFLDGFSAYWLSTRAGPAYEKHWLRAAIAVRKIEADAAAIARWELVMDRVGERAAASIGFTLVDVLSRRHGPRVPLDLARAVLVRPTVENVFDWLDPRRRDLAELLQERTGESWNAFVDAWRKELATRAASGPLFESLRNAADAQVQIRAERSSIGGDLVYSLSGPRLERPRSCTLLHGKLRPYDLFYATDQLTRYAVAWVAGSERVEGRLRGRYQSGQRVFAAIECEHPELGSAVRLAVARLEIP